MWSLKWFDSGGVDVLGLTGFSLLHPATHTQGVSRCSKHVTLHAHTHTFPGTQKWTALDPAKKLQVLSAGRAFFAKDN